MSININTATPEQWDALRKKHPSIVDKYEDFFHRPAEDMQKDYLEYPSVDGGDSPVEDMVNNPNHYNTGSVECIEAIRESMSPVSYKGYLKGNVQKYVWRYEHKGNEIQDLRKARWYLDKLLDAVEEL